MAEFQLEIPCRSLRVPWKRSAHAELVKQQHPMRADCSLEAPTPSVNVLFGDRAGNDLEEQMLGVAGGGTLQGPDCWHKTS